ncbi:MAG: DUF1223 domain-containing protein, partial [Burkholderiales bacterium]
MMKPLAHLLLVVGSLPVVALATDPQTLRCATQAPAFTPVMVELFTSEGCNSCPPADRWLAAKMAPEVIPLAFHITYWDQLGWPDPFAQASFDTRHNHQALVGGKRRLYTPQVFVDGAEALDWRQEAAFAKRALAARQRPASAQLQASWQLVDGHLQLRLSGALPRGEARLFLAVAESGLTSAVAAGENAGKRLEHDHVVRLWQELGTLSAGNFET